MFKGIHFESERLITKSLKKADTPSLFQIYSDHEAMKYRGSKPLNKVEEAYDMVKNQWITNLEISTLRVGIWDKPTNRLVGTLLLKWEHNHPNYCEIGFSFGKDNWNKGYGKETLSMVEEQLRKEDIEILKAWCMKANIASNRIFEKAGYSSIKQTQYPHSNLFSKKL